MSGIYIHIPYCKKVCVYCDFHFSASLKNKDELLESLLLEAELQRHYLGDQEIQTVYFGGGTPSVLTMNETEKIVNQLYKNFQISSAAEITFEANPDDITVEYLNGLRNCGINRLSLGVQSFADADLKWMNRRHNAKEALVAIQNALSCGFENMNIDLIYGLPYSGTDTWETNVKTFVSLGLPHLSAYHLTIEPKTVLGVWKKRGRVFEVVEEESLREYEILVETMEQAGYEHYEISNFCSNGKYSRHNLNYWNQGRYLGLGPSAHSFDGKSRQWNISVNAHYIEAIRTRGQYFEKEILSESEQFNDYLLTHFRTMWGIHFKEIENRFGQKFLDYVKGETARLESSGWIVNNGERAFLTKKGIFVADKIISDMMWVK